MTVNQYNNIAKYTLANMTADTDSSADAARAVMKNCGTGFPHGGNTEIMITLLSDDYMGWATCTRESAQQFANIGTPTVGVSPDRVVVILPDSEENAAIAAESGGRAATVSELSLADTYSMQFFNYSGTSTIIGSNAKTGRKLKSTHYIAQSGRYPYPSSYDGKDHPFHENYFLKKTCGKTGAKSSVSEGGCAACSDAMVAMYKGDFSNAGSSYDVYYVVKEVIIKGTDISFNYDRRDYTVIYSNKSIRMTHSNYFLFDSSENACERMDPYLEDGKFLSLCFKYTGRQGQHFVLVEGIDNKASGLSKYLVVDPAGGIARTLKEVFDEKSNPRLYSACVVS